MQTQALKSISTSRVTLFKVKNRRGYAAICLDHLTEGDDADQAIDRMAKALKRSGLELTGTPPKINE